MTREELYRRIAEHSDGLLALLNELRSDDHLAADHALEFGAIFVCSAGLTALLVGSEEAEPESADEEYAANETALAQLVESGLLEVVREGSES